MPIFDWDRLDGWGVLRAVMFATSPGDAAAARVATENFSAGVQPDQAAEAKLARSRWLERHDAEAAFPCGVVPQAEPPADAPRLNVVPMLRAKPISVMAVVLPTDLVFIREEVSEEVEELGRLPRTAIREVEVVDADGHHIAEPVRETFEPEALSVVVLGWTNDGVEEDEWFGFRSAWLAWRAARKLRAAAPAS
ncbi:MAG TPA: hypothetical protein VE800_09900 [Actinomycetota bacterium]|nr:hypothetical protein [Actinomycetota bacterium]